MILIPQVPVVRQMKLSVVILFSACSVYLGGNHVAASRDISGSKRPIYNSWNDWSQWSRCTRTCGGGVRQRNRVCPRRFEVRNQNLPIVCFGDTTEYSVCNPQSCPAGIDDFRSFQCALYNNKEVSGQIVQEWVPQYGGENPCELRCQGKNRTLPYRFGKVIDGTRCFPGGEEMCVNGRCLPVACDNRIGKDTSVDMCGVCGGDNSTCMHYKDIYLGQYQPKNKSKPQGYQEIALIPAGATHIEIKDTSNNYLALKDDNSYVLNGNWAITWPGEYKVAGTSVRYTRTWDNKETLTAPGPTDKDVHLVVLFRERNPGVFYEYWLPKEKRSKLYHNPSIVTSTTTTTPSPVFYTPRHNRHHFTTRKPIETSFWPSAHHATRSHHSGRRKHKYSTTDHSVQSDSVKEKHIDKDLNYHRYWTDNRVEIDNGGKSTTKPFSISIIPAPDNKKHRYPNNNYHYGDNEKKTKKEKNNSCGRCQKSKDLARHFCTADIVLKVLVLGFEVVNGETRYELEVLQSFKNNVGLAPREYLWTPDRCRCPKMKIGREYIVTGRSDPYYRKNESRLLIDKNSFSKTFNAKLERRVLKLRANQRRKCKKFS